MDEHLPPERVGLARLDFQIECCELCPGIVFNGKKTAFDKVVSDLAIGDVGAWISEGFGDMTAVAITKYGVDGLMAAAKSVPDFWSQIEASYGEAHLRKWLTSFVNYKEEIAKMEAAEEQEVTGNDETT